MRPIHPSVVSLSIVSKVFEDLWPERIKRDPYRPPILEVPEVPKFTVDEQFDMVTLKMEIFEPPEASWMDAGIRALKKALDRELSKRFIGMEATKVTLHMVEAHARDVLVRWIRMGVLGAAPDLGPEPDKWRFDVDSAVQEGIIDPPHDRVWGSTTTWRGTDGEPVTHNDPFVDPETAMSEMKRLIAPDTLVVVQDTMIQYGEHGAYRDTWFSNDGDDFWLWRRFKDGSNTVRPPK